MFILAHANHPEMFFLGLAVGALLVLAQTTWRRTRK